MAVDERARHELRTRLEEILGADPTTTLMSYLPPVGWADVATRRDLTELERRLDLRFEQAEERLVGTLHRELNHQTRALFFSLAGLLVILTALAYVAFQLT